MAKIKTLRQCQLFQALGYRDLAILAPYVEEGTAEKGELLAESGKPTQGLVILKAGRLKLSASEAKGADIEIGPGEFFGELAIAGGSSPRAVTAEALEGCEFLRFEAGSYSKLLADAPDVAGRLAQGLLSTLSVKLDDTRKFLAETAFKA